jgi:hypothetical protein
LTGPAASFEKDGYSNFAKYAENLNPRIKQTNSPVVTAIQVDPNDGLNHIMVTYERRVMPTDVRYGLYGSFDMLNWSSNYFQELRSTPDTNGITETAVSEFLPPYTTSTNTFINLRIWQVVQ